MKRRCIIYAAVMLMYAGAAFAQDSTAIRAILKPNGKVLFAGYVAGKERHGRNQPAYRADLVLYMDIFRYKKIMFNFLTAKSTSARSTDKTPFELDVIRYTLAPGIRYIGRKWLGTVGFVHECIHAISRYDNNGSVYWNEVTAGFGTKGAYHFYLPNRYIFNDFTLNNSFDIRAEAGVCLRGTYAQWIGQNHDYKMDLDGHYDTISCWAAGTAFLPPVQILAGR